ncbi:MAG: hypothetical protein ACR2PT_09370 [Endozoicomonas sp.]
MKKNVTHKLAIALLFYWLTNPGIASSNNNTQVTQYTLADVDTIPIYDTTGHAMDVILGNKDCLVDAAKVKHCLVEMHTNPEDDQRAIYPEPLQRLGKSAIKTNSPISAVSVGTLTVRKDSPAQESVLSYYADFSKVIEWIEKDPILATLMISLHPVLLEPALNHLNPSSQNDTKLADQYVFKVKLKHIPIPEKYKDQISDDVSNQTLMIDLGDHYTMLIRLTPLKVYIGDRLSSAKRTLRNYLAYVHPGLNLFEMFIHTREFGNYALDFGNMFTKRTYKDIPLIAAGMTLHSVETWDHFQQAQKSTSSHLLLEEEKQSYFKWFVEIAHPFHSAYECRYAYKHPNEFTNFHIGLRYLSLALTTANLIKDLIPEDWSESYPDQLLEVFMKNEYGITLEPKEKDEKDETDNNEL